MYQRVSFAVVAAAASFATAQHAVSFLVDPATLPDSNSDGFVNGTDFSPEGSFMSSPDGVVFTMEPTNNLVGFPKFHLSATNGMTFGGGGGSSLAFEFTTNVDILLESYTISSSGFILNDPVFDIREGSSVLSESNSAVANGDTHAFASGPISIEAGTTYTFINTSFGAGTQSHMSSWQYTVVPAPGAIATLAIGGIVASTRRR